MHTSRRCHPAKCTVLEKPRERRYQQKKRLVPHHRNDNVTRKVAGGSDTAYAADTHKSTANRLHLLLILSGTILLCFAKAKGVDFRPRFGLVSNVSVYRAIPYHNMPVPVSSEHSEHEADYIKMSTLWPKGAQIKGWVEGYDVSFKIPVEFVVGSGNNTWELVHTMLNGLVNESGRLCNSEGHPLDLSGPVQAGEVRLVPVGGEDLAKLL